MKDKVSNLHLNSTQEEADIKIIEKFELNVAKFPTSMAIIGDGIEVTYQEFNSKANQLARTLKSKGVGPECLVAIMAERSLEMMIGICAILKAGGAYVPIDPTYPQHRVDYILNDSQAKIVLAQNKFLNYFNNHYHTTINLNDETSYDSNGENIGHIGSSSDLAYVIYTSGSTGKPKGVMVEHRSMVNGLNWLQKTYPINQKDVVMQKASISFDLSVWELFWWMFAGATLCLLKPEGEKDPESIINAIDKHQVTTIYFVPSLLNLFLSYTANPDIVKKLSSLKRVFSIGEALQKNTVDIFDEGITDHNNTQLINLYGPTETTVHVTYYDCYGKEMDGVVPIGKPIDNTRLYIVDEKMRSLSYEQVGELCIAGVGLARGYINMEELTREKFVEHPFDGEERLYRTGDLARLLPDGNVEYIGRIDNQVKIRGFRIEVGEVEHQLREFEEVRDAIVIVRHDKKHQLYLCGYVVPKQVVTEQSLKERLKDILPGFMIPDRLVMIETFPLSPNGKLDRKQLPEPEEIESNHEYVAPQNEIEQTLGELWKEELEVEQISIHDNFFYLGGNSLKAIHLKLNIQKILQVNVPLQVIFEHSTIKSLANYIIGREGKEEYRPILKAIKKPYYPLSSVQKRMYMLNQLDPASVNYNITNVFKIKGYVDIGTLEKALHTLIQRHESLRTRFMIKDKNAVQIIHDKVPFNLDYDEVEVKEADELIKRFVKPFDLSRAPLIRAKLIKLDDYQSIFILDYHHIIADGVSTNIIIDELSQLYAGKPLKPISIQYADYTQWYQEQLDSNTFAAQEKYWLESYSNDPPVLNLPTDFKRPDVQKFEGAKVSFEIDSGLTEHLLKVARDNQATLYMTLLTAFKMLLSRYTDQETIIVGSPIENRQHPDLDMTVGMFANTLVIKSVIDLEKNFEEQLSFIKEESLRIYENQNYPLEDLIKQINLQKDISRNPLFDVMFVLQNMKGSRLSLGEAQVRPYNFDFKTSKVDLSLIAIEKNDGISFDLEYSTNLFKVETIERIVRHFVKLLNEVTKNSTKPIKDIDILSQAEKRQILVEFNQNSTNFPKNKTIQELFEEQVIKFPEQIAVSLDGENLTYAELNQRANSLAQLLRQNGVLPSQLVGLMLERSLEMIVSMLGVLKAGGAYLPIDLDYPSERIAFLLKDSRTNLLLTSSHLAKSNEFSGKTLCIDQISFNREYIQNLEVKNQARDLSYVMYTSGTTGVPKGVCISHRNVIRLVKNTNYIPFSSDTRILQTGAFGFDATTFEVWGALLNGGTLYLIDKEGLLDTTLLKQTIITTSVNTMWLTSPLFNQLVDKDVSLFTSMKYLIVGGDELSPNHINRVREECQQLKVINGYGPTENTTFSTTYEIERYFENRIPIGKPISNTQAYILNKYNHVQPVGVIGELYLGGDGLTSGYFKRPELTKKKFINNPFNKIEKLYKTGDMAKWLPDGNIEFLGRVDHQVKIRGFRIEPGEVENKLLTHNAVNKAIVIVKEHPMSGQKYLCAYYTTTGNVEADHLDLREYLRQSLPAFMVPDHFLYLKEFPLNTNGKVDRKILPEPSHQGAINNAYTAPRNETEMKLVKLWEQALGVEKVSVIDHFYELGGNSLSATLLHAYIQKEFGIRLSLSSILKNPTIEIMAKQIRNDIHQNVMEIPVAQTKKYYPMSSQQGRMFTQQEMNPELTNYNVLTTVTLGQSLDITRFKNVLQHLIDRHESLRTSFEYENGQVHQKVWEKVVLDLEYYDSEDDLHKTPFMRSFDLSQAPLLRVGLVKVDNTTYKLIIDMHHIIIDGLSLIIFFKELQALYEGKMLPELNLQYKDYSEWMNQVRGHEIEARQATFWSDVFKEPSPILELPTDQKRLDNPNLSGAFLTFEINVQQTSALRSFALKEEATLFQILVSIYNVFLMKITGQEDIVIGTPVSGRNYPSLENVIGMFVNTLCLRNYPRQDITFSTFVRNVKQRTIDVFENQDYPFEKLVSEVVKDRRYNHNPLFNTMIALQSFDLYKMNFLGGNIQLSNEHGHFAMFDLNMQIYESEDQLVIDWEYVKQLFSTETMTNFQRYFIEIIDVVIQNPDVKLADIQLSIFPKTNKMEVTNFNFSF
ncbi:amino acid adenylation domain-containing protein [Bacillus sp. 2205SS5-2]|uniref:amino acid adenylation domain-containing protein n=1 Tax=Bacillus sp. 2205SS5-2 TaxID=3109031 RepID=UPI0030044CBC